MGRTILVMHKILTIIQNTVYYSVDVFSATAYYHVY